mmetsp:Transcript_23968/g.55333  ORF Transcript_23968/g.55333 Transcript_23968/m.55333 type:complete len:136 (+) Transcript_23968:81-488(+)
MARALMAVVVAAVVVTCLPLAFTSSSVPKVEVQRAHPAVSFRGSAAASAPADEASSAWMPTLLASAALGLMVSLASPQAAFAEFTKIPSRNPDKVAAKVSTKSQRLQADKAKVDKAKKNKLAVYTDNSEGAFVRA